MNEINKQECQNRLIYKGEKKKEEEAEEGESENANNNNKIENIKKQRMGVESSRTKEEERNATEQLISEQNKTKQDIINVVL